MFFPQISGNVSNMGRLCMAYREADEEKLGNKNFEIDGFS
jgi:hypothetical protein